MPADPEHRRTLWAASLQLAGLAFVVTLGLLRWYHPLLVAGHPGLALKEPLAVAVTVFGLGIFAHFVKRPWE